MIEQPTEDTNTTEEQTEGSIVKIGKLAKAAIPPAFSERCVVRVTGHKFGPNSNHNPMITVDMELVGYFPSSGPEKGQLLGKVEKAGQVYILSGLRLNSAFFTLKDGGLMVYADFWNKAHPGEELTEIDVSNPDRTYLTGLMMEAIVSGKMESYRSQLTEEEKELKRAEGIKSPQGDVLLGADGKPVTFPVVSLSRWLQKYDGDVPEELKAVAK